MLKIDFPNILILFFLPLWLSPLQIKAQDVINEELINADKKLLFNPLVQMEATAAVNDMYNFKFKRAANQFNWFREKYPDHPLPYFLLGLNEWWKMMPNMGVEDFDAKFFQYMDASIDRAKKLYREDKENIEASFFLAAAYAFKSRLNAERKNWAKAAFNGKSALKFLKRGKELNELSPELMFGDALYNYYSVWIPQNYKMLKPIMLFFRKGDQQLGLKQLEEVAQNAFYTRTEAQYFLMRIYRNEEKKPLKALEISKYLAETFPDNAYFQRYYASTIYTLHRYKELEAISRDMLNKIEARQVGYEAVSGRYAAYYLGYLHKYIYRKPEEAKKFYQQAKDFAESTESYKSGYYHSSLVELGRLADKDNNKELAISYFQKVKKYAKKKTKRYQEAKKYLKKNKAKKIK